VINTDPTRRLILFAGLAAAGLAATPVLANPPEGDLSADDRALIAKAAAYLEGLGEVKGRFEQTDSRGGVTHGALYLARPGRARFAYDPPYSLLTVCDGKTVWVSDPRLNTVNHYPLKRTPLSQFLADHVRFDKGVRVDHVERFSDGFTLFARDGNRWAQGRVELTFGDNPMKLREWSLTDPQGRTTRVRLTELEPTSGLDPALFAGPHTGAEPAEAP
jgi:outer membrane lipoprotein-sorting protein